jgi:hypothetical protein
VPFDELTAKKNIGRLQSKLKEARLQLSSAGRTPGVVKANPVGVELIDNTLQIISCMQA